MHLRHWRRWRRSLVGVVTLAVVAGLALPAASAPDRTEGAVGAGDPYFPRAGNGGIDVLRYDLSLDYDPPARASRLVGRLDGVAVITLRTTQRLTRFDLDLRGLRAERVRVDGRPARFTQVPNELRIRPARTLRSGEVVKVRVVYGGATGRPTDLEGALYGWVTTADGAMVVSQPDGSATWFPVSDHPTDKARYRFAVRVPRGLVAVANGLPDGHTTRRGHTTWRWDAPDPMAAYLATATIGDFELRRSRAGGVPVVDAIDADLPASAAAGLSQTDAMMRFLTGRFGAYPFGSYGAIVDDDSVGYALETQTRSFFSRSADESTVVHELAHQWMGNAVSVHRWADIWLNEGWASYAEWMWSEHRGGATAAQSYDRVMAVPADDDLWHSVLADPGPRGLFAPAIYDRGAATLHALRTRIGDDDFFRLARRWVARYSGGTASTRDFQALAETVSGEDLGDFFDTWVRTASKPGL